MLYFRMTIAIAVPIGQVVGIGSCKSTARRKGGGGGGGKGRGAVEEETEYTAAWFMWYSTMRK